MWVKIDNKKDTGPGANINYDKHTDIRVSTNRAPNILHADTLNIGCNLHH